MSNPIKYSTGSESDALKKGNLYIGTGAVGKGPSDTTGYYQGPNVPSNGYVIYMNKVGAPGGLSYHSAANDSELISFTNSLAGESFTTTQQCFNYYYGQTDKVCVSQEFPPDYPYIVMDGLVLYLDAGITQSYPGSGTTWSDINGLGPKNSGTLTNGPTFSGGSVVFDGVDDYVSLSDISLNMSTPWTISFWSFLINPLTPYPEVITFKTNQTYPFEIAFSNVSSYLGVTFGSPNTVQRKTDISLSNYTNKWVFITLTYIGSNSNNANSYVLYDMGLNVPTVQAGGYGVISNQSVLCGGTSATHHWFRGNLGLTQLYNRALSPEEVLQNYNAQKGRFGL